MLGRMPLPCIRRASVCERLASQPELPLLVGIPVFLGIRPFHREDWHCDRFSFGSGNLWHAFDRRVLIGYRCFAETVLAPITRSKKPLILLADAQFGNLPRVLFEVGEFFLQSAFGL